MKADASRIRRCLLVIGAVLFSTAVPAGVATADRADREAIGHERASTLELRLREAIRRLPRAPETPVGYDRDKFRHWVDANGDCQDTRDEVLDAESKIAVSGCDIREGKWVSYYDKATWTDASDVDIDHVVALKEAWDSGAKKWKANTRQRFANDLGDRRSLVAVTDNVNQSKSDQDPTDWTPEFHVCRYVKEWTAVKLRWRLKANRNEKRALQNHADGCGNPVIRVTRARVD